MSDCLKIYRPDGNEPSSYLVDEFIGDAASRDGNGECLFPKEVQGLLEEKGLAQGTDVGELYNNLSCYSYLNGLSGGEDAFYSANDVSDRIDAYYTGRCSSFNIGRLFEQLGKFDPERPVERIVPKKIIWADDAAVREWTKGGLKSLGKDQLLEFLERYNKFLPQVRHNVVMDIFEVLREKIKGGEIFERVKGLGGIVFGIAKEEKRLDWKKYVTALKDIYDEQLNITKIFSNIKPDDCGTFDINYAPQTFLARVIANWSEMGYLEPGELKILTDIIENERHDPDAKIMAARALGRMFYIDSDEKVRAAEFLARYIRELFGDPFWFEKDTARVIYEALRSVGMLGVVHAGDEDVIYALSLGFYSPVFLEKGRPELGWINLGGAIGLTNLYSVLEGEDKALVREILLKDGLTHPSAFCRRHVFNTLKK